MYPWGWHERGKMRQEMQKQRKRLTPCGRAAENSRDPGGMIRQLHQLQRLQLEPIVSDGYVVECVIEYAGW